MTREGGIVIIRGIGVDSPGTEVEVRTHFLSSWAPGFEVVSVDGDEVGLRRRSDGELLPVTVPVDDVRRRLPDGEQQ